MKNYLFFIVIFLGACGPSDDKAESNDARNVSPKESKETGGLDSTNSKALKTDKKASETTTVIENIYEIQEEQPAVEQAAGDEAIKATNEEALGASEEGKESQNRPMEDMQAQEQADSNDKEELEASETRKLNQLEEKGELLEAVEAQEDSTASGAGDKKPEMEEEISVEAKEESQDDQQEVAPNLLELSSSEIMTSPKVVEAQGDSGVNEGVKEPNGEAESPLTPKESQEEGEGSPKRRGHQRLVSGRRIDKMNLAKQRKGVRPPTNHKRLSNVPEGEVGEVVNTEESDDISSVAKNLEGDLNAAAEEEEGDSTKKAEASDLEIKEVASEEDRSLSPSLEDTGEGSGGATPNSQKKKKRGKRGSSRKKR